MLTHTHISGWRRRAARPSLILLLCLLMALAVILSAHPWAVPAQGAHAAGASGDWPTYLQGIDRTGYNAAETAINPTSAPLLHTHWSDSSGGVISTQPVEANGTIFWGSWDGLEHAANATTGAVLWTQNLGQTIDPSCSPSTVGVANSGTVATVTLGGVPTAVLFVGGGNATFYALNAATGAIIWTMRLGTSPSHFLWSSPALFNGSVYEGIASFGDCPLVGGQLVMMAATTGVVTHTFDVVPTGCTGGGVWGSPTIDAGNGLVFIATGNAGGCSSKEPNASALVKLSASSLAFQTSWQVPTSQQISDSDFGSTPTLFRGTVGGVANTPLVGVVNKNGKYYAFKRLHISGGPIWQDQIATAAGSCPQCGNGSISPSAFDGTTLYVAGGGVTWLGLTTTCKGSLWALNPATGATHWRHCLGSGPMLGAVTVVPGVVAVTEGPNMLLINAATGATLLVFLDSHSGSFFYGATSISNGLLYVGNKDGLLFALGT